MLGHSVYVWHRPGDKRLCMATSLGQLALYGYVLGIVDPNLGSHGRTKDQAHHRPAQLTPRVVVAAGGVLRDREGGVGTR